MTSACVRPSELDPLTPPCERRTWMARKVSSVSRGIIKVSGGQQIEQEQKCELYKYVCHKSKKYNYKAKRARMQGIIRVYNAIKCR